MAITDLTGKTLTFNNELVLLVGTYNIDFIDENSTEYTVMNIAVNRIKYGENPVYTILGSDHIWYDDNYKTITITGGTDATNQTLIAWLLENSDLQDDPDPEPTSNISSFNSMSVADNEGYITINIGDTSFDFKKYGGEAPITDLTGTKWQINDITCPAGYGEFYINFSVTNAYDQTQLLIGYEFSFNTGATPQANTIRVLPNNGELSVGDWISFTGGTDVTNSDLIAWLQEHATQVQVTLISFTINGTSYQAEEGMTWAEWCASSYNVDGLVASDAVYNSSHSSYITYNSSIVPPSDTIVANRQYTMTTGGGSN